MSEPKNGAMFWNAVLSGVLVAANLVVANMILSTADFRWDLTEDKRFEVSESSQNILSQFEGTVSVKCYFSSTIPKRYNHVERAVAEKLSEYEELSDGKVIYEIIDPDAEGSKDALNELKDMNIGAVPLQEREGASQQKVLSCYLTMVFRYGDRKSVINLFQDLGSTLHDPGQFTSQLEYFTTQAIRNVTHERRTVGVLAPIELVPTQDRTTVNAEKRKVQGLQTLKRWLQASHDVVMIDPIAVNRGDPIPQEIDVVLCYRPKSFSGAGLYILDQYIMGGGRVAFFVDQGRVNYDPKQKVTQLGNAQMQDFDLPTYDVTPFDHNLTGFLEHYGVRLGNSFVEDMSNFDIQYIRSREVASYRRQYFAKPIYKDAPYPSWPKIPTRNKEGLAVVDNQVSKDWPLLSKTDDIVLCWASPLTIVEENLAKHGATSEVILRTGPNSWNRSLKDTVFSPVPEEWTEPAAKEQQIVATLIRGKFRSYYEKKEAPKVLSNGGLEVDWAPEFLNGRRDRAEDQGMIFVMGDADFVHDSMLRQIINMVAQKKQSRAQDPEAMKIVFSSIRFAANAIDVLCYGDDAKSMFRLLNREVSSRQLKEIKEGDPLMTKILRVNLYGVPGLVLLFCALVVFWRRIRTGAVSV